MIHDQPGPAQSCQIGQPEVHQSDIRLDLAMLQNPFSGSAAPRLKLDDPTPHRDGDGLSAVRGAQLVHQMFDVDFDGFLRNSQ
jgi:hypothetical protein